MKTELRSHTERGTGKAGLGYLWLNGERVLGIRGLSIYESCDKIGTISDINAVQREALNRILQETLEHDADEGISEQWPQLVTKAKEYISGQGYCVQKQDTVTIELRQMIELVTAARTLPVGSARPLTNAGLWHIHSQRRSWPTRRFITHF